MMERFMDIVYKIMKNTAPPFMIAMMCIAISGFIDGSQYHPLSSFYVEQGVSYDTFFNMFSLYLCIGVINTLFNSPKFMKKTLFLYKNILRIVVITLVLIAYIYVLEWFPLDHLEYWMTFLSLYGICVLLSFGISFYLTKKRDGEYQELLDNYKKKH